MLLRVAGVSAISDPLCVCGHRASHHATPDSGDTRCLAVEACEDLIFVFDDGRDGAYGYCACLRFTHAQPTLFDAGTTGDPSSEVSESAA